MLHRLRATGYSYASLRQLAPAVLLWTVPLILWCAWQFYVRPILAADAVVEEPSYTRPLWVAHSDLPYISDKHVRPVAQAPRQAETAVALGNHFDLPLHSQLLDNRIAIMQASTRMLPTQTHGQSAGSGRNVLSIQLKGFEIVYPSYEAGLPDTPGIEVTPIYEDVVIEEKIVPFDTIFVPNATLPLDNQQVIHPGRDGITRTRYRVLYKTTPTGPLEVHRVPENTWIVQKPIERQIEYGQLITPMVFTAANGSQITYWRKIRMFATSYSASTAGVASDDPHYGYTYTGDLMRSGVVAVDPQLIPLRSKLYIPDYGYGDALDIGSAISGRRIDLGYDDSNLIMWYTWVDVYLLWPPPHTSEIPWILSN